MQLLVVNLTGSVLAYLALRKRTVEPEAVIAIPAKAAVDVLYGRRNFALSNLGYCDDSSNEKLQELSGHASSKSYRCSLRRPIALGSLVQLLRTGDDCPWRIYRTKVDKRQTIFILPKRDLSSFLSGLPNSLSLADVCLPGTHDTMAFYGWPVSQCQSAATPLPVQLMQGIRFFDIRLAVIKGKLIAYHGAYPQRSTFQAILADLHAFLSAPGTCGETIVVSIKQEDLGGDFSYRVRAEIEAGPGGIGMWFLENRIPTLGEVRGRAIMFSRFGGNGSDWDGGLEGLGIHPTTWPDSAKEGFEWWCKDTFVRTHDWYRLPSFLDIPEKTALSESMLIPSLESPAPKTLSIAFFSAASPLALPPVVATGWGWPSLGFGMEGVNSRLARFLLAHLGQAGLSRREGRTEANDMPLCAWTFLDFYLEPAGVGVVPLLVECNFHGR